jgi:hypothetical protein
VIEEFAISLCPGTVDLAVGCNVCVGYIWLMESVRSMMVGNLLYRLRVRYRRSADEMMAIVTECLFFLDTKLPALAQSMSLKLQRFAGPVTVVPEQLPDMLPGAVGIGLHDLHEP